MPTQLPPGGFVVLEAEDVSAITDPDGDGKVWTIVQQPDASGGAVLKAPDGSRTNLPGTHETLATYNVLFGAEGSYTAYYLARGFDSSSDSFFTPDDFGVDPDETENLASDGSFRWENGAEFELSASHVGMPLEFRLGRREGDSEIDAIIFHQNGSLSTGQLDAILQELVACDPSTLGDFDGSGVIDFADFLTLSANFGTAAEDHTTGDIDCSGMVGFTDFLILSANFGETAGEIQPIPEPASLHLLLFTVVWAAVVRRRRKS